jgi:hypothetical protein
MKDVSYFMGKDGFSWFVGVVEDRQDPEHCSRVRVRALGFHSEDTSKIPTEDLPWAHVLMPVTAGGMSGIGMSPHFLLEGTWVLGFFRDPAKQEPIILGALPGKNSISKEEYTTVSSSEVGGESREGGFKDPFGQYPTSTYLDMADTNLLAQNDPNDTTEGWDFSKFTQAHASYAHKGGSEINDDVHTKWKNASESDIQQVPSTQDKSAYPFNHVFESESGHYVEFDDTEGNERIQVFHRMGTFIEIDKDGNVVLKTPDTVNMTTIIGGNSDTYIKGNYSLTVDGNMDIHCTAGNVTEVIAKGNVSETITTGTKTVDIKGAVDHTYQDTLTETITGAVTQTYSDAWTLKVTKAVEQTFSLSLKTEITAAAEIKAGAAMTIGGSTVSFN